MSASVGKLLEDIAVQRTADQQREEEYARRVQELAREAEEEYLRAPSVHRAPAPAEDKTTYEILDEASEGLTANACYYLHVLYWLMSAAGYKETTRAWVVAIIAYIDRKCDHSSGAEITDAELADFMNCSERTVQRKRADYLQESHKKLLIISVKEGDYDKQRERNQPTRYHFEIDHLIGDAVIKAQHSKLWEANYRAALKKAAYRVYDSEWERAQGEFPPAVRRRRKKTLSPESERTKILKTMKTEIARLRELESRMEGDFSSEWESLKGEMDALYYGTPKNQNSLQDSDEKELDPMGRQTVAPSNPLPTISKNDRQVATKLAIPDVIVGKDVPNDEATLWRVPSIARAMRELGEKPPP